MRKTISFILTMIMLLSVFSVYASADDFQYDTIASTEEWELLRLINEFRSKNGKGSVSMLVSLQDASGVRSKELLDVLSHYRPDGIPWYSILEANGIEYDTDSYEIIAANALSAEALMTSLTNSEVNMERLLSDCLHVGIGYSESADGENSSAYCIIAIDCDTEASYELCNADDVHLVYGSSVDMTDTVICKSCSHGKGYLPILSSMVQDYDAQKPGTNEITVEFEGVSMPMTVITDYIDSKPGAWYYDAVLSCTDNGYFSGVGNGNFGINTEMTREMFVTVLGRFEGIDTVQYPGSSFDDVKADQWYSPYVEWASEMGIINGDGKGNFNGSKPITRQEICVILCNYIEKNDMIIEQLNAAIDFADADRISSWAFDAVVYAQTRAIVSGNNKGEFMPLNNASRAEVAVILNNFNKAVNK